MGFALRLTCSSADAEDLTQDVFIAAYSSRSAFNGRSRLIVWLLGICFRRWRDSCRRKQVETAQLTDWSELENKAATLSRNADLENQVVDRIALERSLAKLNDAERSAVLLVVSQGLTYKEAAAVTGEPIGTIKWRVSEALSKLRSILGCPENDVAAEGLCK